LRYRVTNLNRNTLLAANAARADSFLSRFKGLMGVAHLPPGEGLHIAPCNSVHTFFMKIPIDVLFLDASQQVVDVMHAMAAWRVSKVYFNAKSVLELPAGTADATGTKTGDTLEFVSN
jgi:uncharacterized membrane protein (UPF0127 family)